MVAKSTQISKISKSHGVKEADTDEDGVEAAGTSKQPGKHTAASRHSMEP
jgi:hypothetical protein